MAQRFEFSLQTLLDLRQRAEDEKQRALAVRQREAEGVRKQIRNTERAMFDQNKHLAAHHLIGTLDLSYISNEKRFVGSLHILLVNLHQKLRKADELANAARVELLAAARARKALTKLREKHLERWRREQDVAEAAALDEITTQLAFRARSSGLGIGTGAL
jgi:flagellar export protein FliJ